MVNYYSNVRNECIVDKHFATLQVIPLGPMNCLLCTYKINSLFNM